MHYHWNCCIDWMRDRNREIRFQPQCHIFPGMSTRCTWFPWKKSEGHDRHRWIFYEIFAGTPNGARLGGATGTQTRRPHNASCTTAWVSLSVHILEIFSSLITPPSSSLQSRTSCRFLTWFVPWSLASLYIFTKSRNKTHSPTLRPSIVFAICLHWTSYCVRCSL